MQETPQTYNLIAAILNKFAYLEKHIIFYVWNPPVLESAQNLTIDTIQKMNICRYARNLLD